MDVEDPSRASSSFAEYLRRGLHYSQMDLETSFWQMFHLCVNPKKVYSRVRVHQMTKRQWARDDPGFVLVMILYMLAGSLAFAVAFSGNFFVIIWLVFWTILVDFLLVGAVIATIGWWVSNTYFRNATVTTDAIGQVYGQPTVEWLYSFDIHCNSFFPVFMLLYVVQYLFIMLLYTNSFFSTLLSNTLYLIALGYYYYITWLGYSSLKFLSHTQLIFIPFAISSFLYLLALIFNFNFTIAVMNFYFGFGR